MKKRIFAWVCIILLACMYVGAFICAVIGTAETMTLFIACVVGTIAIPIMGHLVLVMANMKKGGALFDDPYHPEKKTEEENDSTK